MTISLRACPAWSVASICLCFAPLAMVLSAERAEVAEPLPATAAAATMKVPEGFQVKLFAAEPDIRQPIGFCMDDRARLWVAEAYSYPHHTTEGNDRIVILEDTNGDGHHDHRTVFFDQLNYVTGIEVGFGGVWVMSPPYFYFIPDANADDVPDGPPQLLLDGFGTHANSHNLANGFAWGPDGWLYGTHGRTNWSLIGKPGTAADQRQRFDGGVWRYHPTRHVWEPFADGTTNPWGIDWDDYGAAFVCNCVNPHLFQVIQGAHYEPWRGRQSSRYAYERIDTIADHLHYLGGDYREGIGSELEDDLGGGHAHCGTMVYLGDNFPARYRNTVFMHNVHGRRINNDTLIRSGSGYRATHLPDLMRSADPWFMGVTLAYGPGGEVYSADWSDTGECHSVRNTRKHTGRIFRLSYGELTVPRVNLQQLPDAELVALQMHQNDWYVRHARRLLQERHARGDDLSEVHAALQEILASSELTRQLRALWALKVTGGLSEEQLIALLSHESEYLRAWAVQFLCEDFEVPRSALEKFTQLAREGDSPVVRLYLASALQRLAPAERWPIAEALASRGSDADDQNLPLMLWYAVEPLVEQDRKRLISLAGVTEIPLLQRHIARRVASLNEDRTEALEELIEVLTKVPSSQQRLTLLEGMLQGLEGSRKVPAPDNWAAAYASMSGAGNAATSRQVALRATELALLFDDREAQRSLLERVANPSFPLADRQQALAALADARYAPLLPVLFELLAEEPMQTAALQGLTRFHHEDTAARVLNVYDQLTQSAQQVALQTLATRAAWAHTMLDSMEAGQLDPKQLSAYTARQLQSLGDKDLTQRVQQIWGQLRSTPSEKRQLMAETRHIVEHATNTADVDTRLGRALFEKTCGKCHRMFGEGGQIGPELTGAQRHNLDYLLENIVDPSAAVSRDYLTEVVHTLDGRVISGLLVTEDDRTVVIQTIDERVVIPVEDIDQRKKSAVSMMPDNLLATLSPGEVRALFAYLQSKQQVSLP